MMYNSGDTAVLNGHVFICTNVVTDRNIANKRAREIRGKGFLARVTVRTKRYVGKEPAGSYFAGHGGFEVATYCVWKGPHKRRT